MTETHLESWEEHRKEMLRETSRFIEWGLRHPDLVIHIPAKRIGEGGWPKKVGQWFWSVVLTDRTDSTIERWRDRLRRSADWILRRE